MAENATSLTAGIVVTGTEVLRGIISDRNGPWLTERLRELGLRVHHTIVVGDNKADIRRALDFFKQANVDLIITTGGLGPTDDDYTAEVVADFAQRQLVLDAELEERIWQILTHIKDRWGKALDEESMRETNRKQALIPDQALILDPVGTAPGFVLLPQKDNHQTESPIVVFPGPPAELQPMWQQAVDGPLQATLADGKGLDERLFRLWGLPESAITVALKEIEAEGVAIDQLELTTCVRRGELEVSAVFESDKAPIYDRLLEGIKTRFAEQLFSVDGTTIDQQVAELLVGREIAVAESCTGGLMAARLTEIPGSSEYFVGGVVAYSNMVKTEFLDVPEIVIERFGAVSPEVASVLADGALLRFGCELGIGITGVAGPGGGTPEKPVGTISISVSHCDGERINHDSVLPGDRATVRERTTTIAMHLLRKLLLALDHHEEDSPIQAQ